MTLSPRFFPTVMIVLDVFASMVYCDRGDWRRTLYWLFAAGLTYVITY